MCTEQQGSGYIQQLNEEGAKRLLTKYHIALTNIVDVLHIAGSWYSKGEPTAEAYLLAVTALEKETEDEICTDTTD